MIVATPVALFIEVSTPEPFCLEMCLWDLLLNRVPSSILQCRDSAIGFGFGGYPISHTDSIETFTNFELNRSKLDEFVGASVHFGNKRSQSRAIILLFFVFMAR
ncbi:hypothetical protein DD238_001247 [Peronospora effusa]|uniref:Uncharacterized protein n=1 Tax=Peronospora effusa TaxID=542832 RepID=A0A3M6VJ69_9STRA|nr:hypothetical protein DD238_001247 [Peronospora effusa]